MRPAVNIYPMSEKFTFEGPKTIIIFTIFSCTIIKVNSRLTNFNNLTVQQKNIIIYVRQTTEKSDAAHCAPWPIVPDSPQQGIFYSSVVEEKILIIRNIFSTE